MHARLEKRLQLPLARPIKRLHSTVLELFTAFGAVVAPSRCLGCLRETTWLCRFCSQLIVRPRLRCIGCETASSRGLTCQRCASRIALTGCVSGGSYHSPVFRRGVHWLKFKGIRSLVPVLARLVIPSLVTIAPLHELQRSAAFVPVPLHARRLRQRGFNQSSDLARALSTSIGIPMCDVLVRTRSTWAQARLPHELRAENTDGAFSLAGTLPPSLTYCLLVDDVTTTGSTLSAAAVPLKASGVPQVWGVTVARG